MKPTKITNRNIMFSQPMGETYSLNMGLIMGVCNNFLIDTGIGCGSVAPVLKYLKDKDNSKPVIVINTHSCWDHVWGNWVFGNCLIISHKQCREDLKEHWDNVVRELSHRIDGEVHKCLPNMTFESSMYFPEDGISLFHTPGHTPGDISVYDAIDKVLYAGDNIGDTQDEIVPWIGTDMETMRSTIDIFKKIDFEICISGHNKPQGYDVLARMEAALPEAWEKQNA